MHYQKGTGYVEVSGRKVCSKREMELRLARAYGRAGDMAAFTRLQIESRTASRQALLDAYNGRENDTSALAGASPLDIFSGQIIQLT